MSEAVDKLIAALTMLCDNAEAYGDEIEVADIRAILANCCAS